MSGTQDENPPPPPPQPTQQQTPTPTQTPHTVSTIKLPILKKGEYDIWAMKMEHYLAHTDYPIWEVIQNGNGPVSVTTDTTGQIKILPPKTGEEVVARERERKARTYLKHVGNFKHSELKSTQLTLLLGESWLCSRQTVLGDDLIACLNKAMDFLTVVASSRVTMQQVQGRQGQSYSGTGYKSNATSFRGNNVSGQARIVKCYNYQAEAQEAGQILDEEQLAFLADLETEDLDTYDSDCDDILNAKAVLMANISNYGFDVISEVPHSKTYLNDMENQSVHAIHDFEQTHVVDFINNEIHSDSNIIPYSQYLQETQQANVQDTSLQAQQDSII
ncbi:hypothetical protein Tco_1284791 [Tanacetum coccineum]